MASQTSDAPQAPAIDMAVDRQEMQSLVPTTCRSRQAAAASRNKARAGRFAGSWDSRSGPLRRSQLEAEEEVLEHKRQFEATRPQILEASEVLAAPALEDLISARPV